MSYRRFLSRSLTTDELKAINRGAPKNVKYCNGLCQDFRCEEDFSSHHKICKNCRNMLSAAEKKIDQNLITLQQFIDDPNIINDENIELEYTTKTCNVCKTDKILSQFENKRKTCKACRAIQASERNNKDIDVHIENIEKLREKNYELEIYVRQIPKDKLVKIMSWFKISRKPTDKKDRMVYNCAKHFQLLQSNNICTGVCGKTVLTPNTMCGACERLKEIKNKREMSNIDFENNLDEIIETLESVKITDYNIKKMFMIARRLSIRAKSLTPKAELVDLINDKLKRRIVENKTMNNLAELQLNGVVVFSRKEDSYINATRLCKAGGKIFRDWHILKSTKEFISLIENDCGIPQSNLVQIKKGGKPELQGTWIHPDLAVQLAQWLSPKFAQKVSKWVRELAITGKVEIGAEKSEQTLLELNQKLLDSEEKFKKLEKSYKNTLYRRNLHKYKRGPVFYIISDGDSQSKSYKPGIDTVDINVRLQQHRSTKPGIRLEFLIYTNKCVLIEQTLLQRFQDQREFKNHEWIFNVELNDIITSVRTFLSFANIPFTEETDLELINE